MDVGTQLIVREQISGGEIRFYVWSFFLRFVVCSTSVESARMRANGGYLWHLVQMNATSYGGSKFYDVTFEVLCNFRTCTS